MEEEKNYIKRFFNSSDTFSTVEQFEVAGLFTRWINEDEAR